jgi:fatty acid desaturase
MPALRSNGDLAFAAIGRGDVPPQLLEHACVPRLLRQAAADWLVIASTWFALWLAPAWLYPFGLLIIAGRLHALGVVLHDACHMPRPARRTSTWLLELLAGYPIATTLSAMRYHHLRHHRYSGMPQDPYFKAGVSSSARLRALMSLRGFLLVPAWILRGFYGSAALMIPRLRNSYGRFFLQDRSGCDVSASLELRECLRHEPGQALFFVLVCVAAVRYPAVVAAYYLAPLVLAGALNVNRVIVEHVHVLCTDRRPETVSATTVTHDWDAPGKLFLFPRNIGFHLVHHLHPSAALDNLPALDRWYRQRTVPQP